MIDNEKVIKLGTFEKIKTIEQNNFQKYNKKIVSFLFLGPIDKVVTQNRAIYAKFEGLLVE